MAGIELVAFRLSVPGQDILDFRGARSITYRLEGLLHLVGETITLEWAAMRRTRQFSLTGVKDEVDHSPIGNRGRSSGLDHSGATARWLVGPQAPTLGPPTRRFRRHPWRTVGHDRSFAPTAGTATRPAQWLRASTLPRAATTLLDDAKRRSIRPGDRDP